MMAKRVLSLFMVFLVLVVVATLSVYALNDFTEEGGSAGKRSVALESCNMSVNTDILQDSTIYGIIANADSLLSNCQQVTFASNPYIERLLSCNEVLYCDSVRMENDRVILVTDAYAEKSEAMRYLILYSYITTEYADCLTLADPNYDFMTYNRVVFPYLFVCPSFRTSGYDTMESYYHAIRSGECAAPADAYLLSYWSSIVRQYAGGNNLDI